VKKSHAANAGAGVACADSLVGRGLRVETLLLGRARSSDSEPAFDILAAFWLPAKIPRLETTQGGQTPAPRRSTIAGGRIDLMELLGPDALHLTAPFAPFVRSVLARDDPIGERGSASGIQNAGPWSVLQSSHRPRKTKTRKMEAACHHVVAQRHSRGSAWYQLIDDGGRIGETGGLNDHTGKTCGSILSGSLHANRTAKI